MEKVIKLVPYNQDKRGYNRGALMMLTTTITVLTLASLVDAIWGEQGFWESSVGTLIIVNITGITAAVCLIVDILFFRKRDAKCKEIHLQQCSE